jgi:hypothetical protein
MACQEEFRLQQKLVTLLSFCIFHPNICYEASKIVLLCVFVTPSQCVIELQITEPSLVREGALREEERK